MNAFIGALLVASAFVGGALIGAELGNPAEGAAIAKDVVLTLAAVVGMYIALRGLSTWNRQLKGGVEYELTRRLLKCTYRLREAIKGVRNPLIWANEEPTPPEDKAKSMSVDQRRYYGLSRAYQQRWDKVTEVRNDLQTELLEAEALWGKEVYDHFEPLFKLQQELFDDVRSYLIVSNPDENEQTRRALTDIRGKRRDIMYELPSKAAPDVFASEVAQAISAIETYLKPHLRK